MRKILIISPHFPPSNLAGVHRARLFAQHLPSFGWKPVILTVDEKFYEEEPDWNLVSLLPKNLRIEKTSAFRVTRPRIIGDIGLRTFFQSYKRAKELIVKERIDFLYIPIPSFYVALLGRWLHSSTGIRYGIDYIDPWVHRFPGDDKLFSRHWFSAKLASILEPVAIKKAALITGVAEGYYKPVLKRNPHLENTAVCGAMPYGGEPMDHAKLDQLNIAPYLFQKKNKLQLVYAGALLPKAYEPLESVFGCMAGNKTEFDKVEFHFIGTGKTPNDPQGYSVKHLAIKYGLWQHIIFEYPQRIPYLDVLVHLKIADGIFILGSTEPHYTPSKTYQGILSGKALLAVLHKGSTAVNVIRQARAGIVLDYNGQEDLKRLKENFLPVFLQYKDMLTTFDSREVDTDIFEQYSAKNVTGQLAMLLDKAL